KTVPFSCAKPSNAAAPWRSLLFQAAGGSVFSFTFCVPHFQFFKIGSWMGHFFSQDWDIEVPLFQMSFFIIQNEPSGKRREFREKMRFYKKILQF
ncbi:MAG: hypothetical protein RSC89_07050, partial [Oscillospiraceae bacterium]